jgi:hypothetical protein
VTDGLISYISIVRHPIIPLGYSVAGLVQQVGCKVVDVAHVEVIAVAGEWQACHAEYVAVPRNSLEKRSEGRSTKGAFAAIGTVAILGFKFWSSKIMLCFVREHSCRQLSAGKYQD